MTLWDSICRAYANFSASIGQFVLDWWGLLGTLVVMAIIVGLAINGHRRMRVDPSVAFTPEETDPLSDEIRAKLSEWRTHPDVAYALGEVLAREDEQA